MLIHLIKILTTVCFIKVVNGPIQWISLKTVKFALDELTVLEIFLIKREMNTGEIWCSTCWKWYIFMYTANFINKFRVLLYLIIWSFFGPYFPVCGLNSEIYFVNLRIQSEYAKTGTRKNSVVWHFSPSVLSFLEN